MDLALAASLTQTALGFWYCTYWGGRWLRIRLLAPPDTLAGGGAGDLVREYD